MDYLKHYSSLPEFQNMEIQQVIEELEEAVAKDAAPQDRLFQLRQA